MLAKTKIAYIITLPDLGGAQSHVLELIRNMPQYDTEPFLITGKKGWLTKEAELLGVKVYVVLELVREISPRQDIQAILRLKKIIKKEQPHIVHCHSSKAGIVGRTAAKLCGVPAIFTAHGWAFTDGVSQKKRMMYRFIENMAGYMTSKIICVSDYDRKLGMKMLPAHKDKMVTVHNCIPDTKYVRDWEKCPIKDELHAVVIARFSPPKKNIEILRILRKLLDKGMPITITFIGDGPDFSKAKIEAKHLNLGDKAIFLGARTDVEKLLPNYDIFLLLSNWEGFPISILEAMRAGLPVIASNVGGVSESVKHNITGWLINNDEEAEKLLSDMDYEKLAQAGKNGRSEFEKEYEVSNMINDIVDKSYGVVMKK